MRIVIDTNLFVSGVVTRGGLPHQLLDELHRLNVTLIMSWAQEVELRSVLSRPRIRSLNNITDFEIAEILGLAGEYVDTDAVAGALPVKVRDPKDEPILASAIAGRADYLVTGDQDLLELADNELIAPLQILTVRTFLEILEVSDI